MMAFLVMLTFIGTNLQTVLWQSSDWLVSTVLPSVVINLTNEERADNSAKPLVRNEVLDKAAKMKAEHMAKNEYFAHFSPAGVSPWHWFDEVGYVYAHAGENLAIHFTDSSEVVEAWMDSPTHRKNIVDKRYTEIGVGTAKGKFEGYETVYVVQLFGAPAVKIAPTPEIIPEPEPVLVSVADTPVEVTTEAPQPVDSVTAPVLAAETTSAEVELVNTKTKPVPEEVVIPDAQETETAEPVLTPVEVVPAEPVHSAEVYVVESPIISTSSGLAVAQVTYATQDSKDSVIASVATQPNYLLQITYLAIGFVVVLLLSASVVLETRKFHYTQAAYGLLLLLVMGGLWYAHSLLTTGAVIV